jgi:hypothetical protein
MVEKCTAIWAAEIREYLSRRRPCHRDDDNIATAICCADSQSLPRASVATAACVVIFFPLPLGRGRKSLLKTASLSTWPLALVLPPMTGCGGGVGSATPTPTPTPTPLTTPAGTYTVTLTVSEAGYSHSIPLTLVVKNCLGRVRKLWSCRREKRGRRRGRWLPTGECLVVSFQ